MAYENLCMYCFEDIEGKSVCPHCGRDSRAAVPQIQMLPGSQVYHDRFLIGRALGQDANGIVYSAFDTKREDKLRIREYLPRDCAERLNDGGVVPIAGKEDAFEAGMRKLHATVESVEDPRKRHFYFEENGTAYIAQRKPPKAASDGEEEAEESGISRRLLVFIGIAVVAVVAAAIGLISLFNGALDTPKDISQAPSVNPNEVWIPVETPTPTPYVAPTFAALVDPDLAWSDYDYGGATTGPTLKPGTADITGTAQGLDWNTTTAAPTPATTPRGDTSQYKLVNRKSRSTDIRALQQKLAELGWLTTGQITGSYDADTVQAVKDLQSYVNDTFGAKLSVDGIAGPKTQQWIYEADVRKVTVTPAPTPTAAPQEELIRAGSDSGKVRSVQQKLITLGLMPRGSADGRYGSATVTAVKKFQQRVNQLQGYEVLEVTGTVDPLTLSFLNYYAEEWEKLRSATATPAPIVTPLPESTEIDETDKTTIDSSSYPESIQRVQEMLIAIGMMRDGSADGKYGKDTSSAVMLFQQWVNTMRGEQTLPITGIVDYVTRQYLEYCYDRDIHPYATPVPTDTPAPTPTPAPTAAPTPTPEEEEPDEGGEISVGPGSEPESIAYVQQMLASVGLLGELDITSSYDETTTRAVRAFQQWVNSQRGEGTVNVTGYLDDQTRQYLEYCFDRGITVGGAATEAPTEAPTAEPSQAPSEEPDEDKAEEIGPDSEPESISYVQRMLASVGLMSDAGVTGSYDDATMQAVRAFQQWVNSQRGEGTVNVTGYLDDATRRYLEYCYDRDITVGTAQEEPTATPTAEPTATPTVAPAAVSEVDVTVDGIADTGNVMYVSEGKVPVAWAADGEVAGYSITVQDASGAAILSREGIADTSFFVDTSLMNPGEVYTLTVGAMPADGGETVWRKVRFALPDIEIAAPSITIAGVTAGSSTVTVEDDSFVLSWDAAGDVAGYFVTIADANGNQIGEGMNNTTQTSITVRAADMVPGMVYTLKVGALPVNGGREDIQWSTATFQRPVQETATATPTPEVTATPTPAPTARVGRPVINIDGSAYQKDGVPYITASNIIVSWSAEGNVDSYYVYIENEAGQRVTLGRTTDTSRSVPTSQLPVGSYTIHVGVLPVGGAASDAQWNTYTFVIPAAEAAPSASTEAQPQNPPSQEPQQDQGGDQDGAEDLGGAEGFDGDEDLGGDEDDVNPFDVSGFANAEEDALDPDTSASPLSTLDPDGFTDDSDDSGLLEDVLLPIE